MLLKGRERGNGPIGNVPDQSGMSPNKSGISRKIGKSQKEQIETDAPQSGNHPRLKLPCLADHNFYLFVLLRFFFSSHSPMTQASNCHSLETWGISPQPVCTDPVQSFPNVLVFLTFLFRAFAMNARPRSGATLHQPCHCFLTLPNSRADGPSVGTRKSMQRFSGQSLSRTLQTIDVRTKTRVCPEQKRRVFLRPRWGVETF